jgi:hypothetical protein
MKQIIWCMERLRHILRGPAIFIIPVAAACLLGLTSIFSGLSLDDYISRAAMVQSDSLPQFLNRSPLDAFSFTTRNDPGAMREGIERGIWPWWTAPEYKISFCRPLVSLTHWFDYNTFKDAYWAMHLHSTIWYALLVLVAACAYRRFFSTPWIAGMAALLYAIDSGHGLGVAYISNRHAVITVLCSILTLIFYDSWRRNQDTRAGVAASLFYCIGLLTGESTVSLCAYLFSYAVFIEKGSIWKKLTPLIPFAVITIIWRLIYVAYSFSVAGTSLYVDPLHDTASFMASFLPRISALLLSQFIGSHAVLTNFLQPNLIPAYCAVAIFLLLLMYYAVHPLMNKASMRFFGLGTALSMVPFCTALPDDRLLILPGFGAIGIIAAFLAAVGDRAAASCFNTKLRRTMAVLFFMVHFILAPVQFQTNAFIVYLLQNPVNKIAKDISTCSLTPDTKVVLLNAPMDITVTYVFFTLMERGVIPPPMLLLSAGETDVVVERTDDRTLHLHLREGLCGAVFERIFRGNPTLIKVGDTFDLPDVSVLVEGLTSDGRPADLSYTFRQPLETSAMKWFYCTWQGLRPFTLPAVGAEVTIPKLPHFIKLMLMNI